MTTEGSADSATGAVSALMEERRRYESWIAALEQKRASTPDHVFTRVHADYLGRLDAVVARLATHADGLRQEIETLTGRLSGVREEHRAAIDERAEAELRAHVGEVTTEEWERVASASDARLGDLQSRGADIERELARTRELLEDTVRPTPVPAHAAQPSDVKEDVAEPVAASDSAEAEVHVPVAAEQASPDVQEVAAVAPPPLPEPVTAPQASPGFDELSFLRSVVDSPVSTPEVRPSDEPDEATKLDSFARRSHDEPVQRLAAEQPLIMRSGGEDLDRHPTAYQHTPGSALDRVKDPAIEGNKTLRCGECGSLNYPTEWYCERCGAELASL
jgi:hypothetical protein